MSRRKPPSSDPRHGTQRQQRVGEFLRRALANILQRADLHEPDLEGVSLTITEVKVSPDLSSATVFIASFEDQNTKSVLEALKRSSPYIRNLLAPEITFKRTPALRFVMDDTLDRIHKIEHLLETIHSQGSKSSTQIPHSDE